MCAAKKFITPQILILPRFSSPFSCEKNQIQYLNAMKLSGLLAASVAAASATVVTVSAPAKDTYQDGLARKGLNESSSVRSSSAVVSGNLVRPWIAVAYSVPIAVGTAVFLIYPISPFS